MHPPDSTQLGWQVLWLFVLAIPVACVAWTVTHEEVFKEPREFCVQRSQTCRKIVQRKFYYLFTCEYCFSHYVTLAFIYLTGFKLLLDNWVGYVISFFALVFVANAYMSLYGRLRVEISSERKTMEATERETELKEKETQLREQQLRQMQERRGANGH